MREKILKLASANVVLLIVVATVLYALYSANMKIGAEPFGANLGGLRLSPWVALVAVWFNFLFAVVFNLFDWQWVRREPLRFLGEGCCVSGLVIPGSAVVALKAIKVTEATNLLKGESVPIVILALMIFLPKERAKLLKDRYQQIGALLAILAISLNFWGMKESAGFEQVRYFVYCLAGVYGASCFFRAPIMRTANAGHPLAYFAGGQTVATFIVTAFFAWVAFGDLAYIPAILQPHLLEMRAGLLQPTWPLLKWALLSGIPFGLYAPVSVLLLSNRDGGATAALGVVMQKMSTNVGGVSASPLIHVYVALAVSWAASSRLPWYEPKEFAAAMLLLAGVGISLIPQWRQYQKDRARERLSQLVTVSG